MTHDELLVRLTQDPETPSPSRPEPFKKVANLRKYATLIRHSLRAQFPLVDQVNHLYIFTVEESERTGLDGICLTLADGDAVIGVSESVFDSEIYLQQVLLHEFGHLYGTKGHDDTFGTVLTAMTALYTTKTGAKISPDTQMLDTEEV